MSQGVLSREEVREKYSCLPSSERVLADAFSVDFPWVIDAYCAGGGKHLSLMQLARILIQEGVHKNIVVVKNGIHRLLLNSVNGKLLWETGRAHNCSPRTRETREKMSVSSRDAVMLRGQYPFNNRTIKIDGREYSEIQYIALIKESGIFDYKGGWKDLFTRVYGTDCAFPAQREGFTDRTPLTIKLAYSGYKRKIRKVSSK